MRQKKSQTSTHQVEGNFLSFLPNSKNELKYMQLQVGERIIAVKLAKELRKPISNKLVAGDQLLVSLEQKELGKGSCLKLKTDHIEKLNTGRKPIVFRTKSYSKEDKILLCHNSKCAKRGGKKLYFALAEALEKLGLQNKVLIEITGCQKQCKKAPSFILMPGKVVHNYVDPKNLTALLADHYQ
ncbi:MAG: (2Fe-2S) ferredoxin domain-containing protein [Halothece sp. Uz-M2-17]|nr:(2Fe-2S) ferredoxin domain-containing protein [Halothece sp. Uz-M2-17]